MQASELIQAACNTTLPVIIAGDLNTDSPSGNPTDNAGYQILRSSAFSDIWTSFHEGEAGNTWPLHVGDSLTATTPSQRIDIVFFRGAIDTEEVELVGDLPTSGLWPSDHAVVVALFDLKSQ